MAGLGVEVTGEQGRLEGNLKQDVSLQKRKRSLASKKVVLCSTSWDPSQNTLHGPHATLCSLHLPCPLPLALGHRPTENDVITIHCPISYRKIIENRAH